MNKHSTIHAEKQQLRTKALAVRTSLTQDTDFLLKSVSAIARQLLTVPEVTAALNSKRRPLFASYAPSKGEPNPNGFLDMLEGRHDCSSSAVQMAFPRVAGKGKLEMHFAVLDQLAPGSFGIPEPSADLPLARLEDIDIMLVPGLAFDITGNRLGYGKGFYDQLLASAKSQRQAPLIGISYDETLYSAIPTEAHDKRMDYIITPTRVVASSRKS